MDILFTTLGLDSKEKRIFLRLLSLGATPVSMLAKAVGLPRSSVYVVLERLKQLKVLETFKQGGKLFVQCIPPEDLEKLLQNKQSRVERALEDYREHLGALKEIQNQESVIPKVDFLEGKAGILKAYRRVLKEKRFYSYFNPASVKKFTPEIFLYIPENLKKVKGEAKEFLVDCPEAKEYAAAIHNPDHQVKTLPAGLKFFSDNILCDDKIFLFSYEKDQACVVEITNKNLADTQQKMFELLWERS